MSERKQKKNDNEQKKNKKKLKPEHIVYIVLGILIVTALVAVPIIIGATSASGAGATVPPCCE